MLILLTGCVASTQQSRVSPLPVNPSVGDTWTEPRTGLEFIWVPSGCFQMGQSETEKQYLIDELGQYYAWLDVERPLHKVCVDGFWMGKYEVTNKQYMKFRPSFLKSKTGGRMPFTPKDDHPATHDVTWNHAKAYAKVVEFDEIIEQ